VLSPEHGKAESANGASQLGPADRVHHKPSEQSVGQQQRVALARTLANNSALILADEPTGNLDPGTREQVLEMFDEFHHEGRTLVMVTHDPAAASRAQRTLHLEQGAVRSDQCSAKPRRVVA
jgi:putative ABC transport system ATP-binding protein